MALFNVSKIAGGQETKYSPARAFQLKAHSVRSLLDEKARGTKSYGAICTQQNLLRSLFAKTFGWTGSNCEYLKIKMTSDK